jgi:hypothetical protein
VERTAKNLEPECNTFALIVRPMIQNPHLKRTKTAKHGSSALSTRKNEEHIQSETCAEIVCQPSKQRRVTQILQVTQRSCVRSMQRFADLTKYNTLAWTVLRMIKQILRSQTKTGKRGNSVETTLINGVVTVCKIRAQCAQKMRSFKQITKTLKEKRSCVDNMRMSLERIEFVVRASCVLKILKHRTRTSLEKNISFARTMREKKVRTKSNFRAKIVQKTQKSKLGTKMRRDVVQDCAQHTRANEAATLCGTLALPALQK